MNDIINTVKSTGRKRKRKRRRRRRRSALQGTIMMTNTNMIVLRPNKFFLLLAFVVGILGSTIFVVNAKSGTGIREMVEAKCNRERERQLAPQAGISFDRSGGELDDVDDDADRIWRYISRSSVGTGSMEMSVLVVSSLPQRSSPGEDQPAELCGFLDDLQGFEVLECRGYTVAGFMNVCDESILETVESHEDVTGIGPNFTGESSSSSTGTGGDRFTGSGTVKSQADRFTGSGTVKSQAISALQIIALLKKYPLLTGEGMRIGIISDSFDNPSEVLRTTMADDIATRNLPSEADGNKVIILKDDSTQYTRDEGRAIAQLIYDLIPKAQMYFYTGFLPQSNFAEAIEALVAEDVDIIIDDVGYQYEPMYQLGFSAQAANEAAKKGIPYFSAAGNRANNSYETIYKPTKCSRDLTSPYLPNTKYKSCLDFGNGEDKQVLEFSKSGGNILLFWEAPYGTVSGPGASSETIPYPCDIPQPPTAPFLDFYMFNNTDGSENQPPLFVSDFFPNTGYACQTLIVNPNFFDEYTTSYSFVVAEQSGPSEDATGIRIKLLLRNVEIKSSSPGLYDKATVTGTANAPLTAGVAAASDQQTFGNLVPSKTTGLGGIPIIFDEKGVKYPVTPIYRQPRFTGPDGSFNTFFGVYKRGLTRFQKSETTPPKFYGTSASAPNVAAVGIILLQACKMYGNNRRLKIDDEDEDRYKDDERRKMKRKLKSESQRSKSTKSSKSKTSKSNRRKPFDCTKPSNIYKLLETTAIDMNEHGYDFLTGYGFVNALAAVDKLIELINDPVAADEFERKLNHDDDLNEDEEEKHCPNDSFLNPVTSSFDEEYVNPTDSPTASPTDSPTASPSSTGM